MAGRIRLQMNGISPYENRSLNGWPQKGKEINSPQSQGSNSESDP